MLARTAEFKSLHRCRGKRLGLLFSWHLVPLWICHLLCCNRYRGWRISFPIPTLRCRDSGRVLPDVSPKHLQVILLSETNLCAIIIQWIPLQIQSGSGHRPDLLQHRYHWIIPGCQLFLWDKQRFSRLLRARHRHRNRRKRRRVAHGDID